MLVEEMSHLPMFLMWSMAVEAAPFMVEDVVRRQSYKSLISMAVLIRLYCPIRMMGGVMRVG